MNFTFLPDLSALAIIIVILLLVRRRHRDHRADAWVVGLGLTLVEAVTHTFYAPNAMPGRLLHVIVLDCYALAGLVFLWAASDLRTARRRHLVYLTLSGLPLLMLSTVYGLNLRAAHYYIPAIAAGLLLASVTTVYLRLNWRFAALQVLGWIAVGCMVAQGNYRMAVYWSLGSLYLAVAANFHRRLAADSTGRFAIVIGFTIWAACFFLHPWVVHYPDYSDLASHLWNMQKSLISIGMILVLLEEQVSNSEWLALHDELTGLPNRRMFAGSLNRAIEHSDRRSTSLALVVLDLNGFKGINDTLGHDAGDQVLREISSTLRRSVRATDTVARLGGDEFIIVATDMANNRAAERFADSIRCAIERPFTLQGKPMQVTASLGFAMYPGDAGDATRLVRLADQRMYGRKAKPLQRIRTENLLKMSPGVETLDRAG